MIARSKFPYYLMQHSFCVCLFVLSLVRLIYFTISFVVFIGRFYTRRLIRLGRTWANINTVARIVMSRS